MSTPDNKSLFVGLLGSVIAAILFVLSCPPFEHAAAAWLVPGVLLVSVRRLPYRHAFEAGFLFGVLSAGLIGRWLPDSLVLGFELTPFLASLIAYGGISIGIGIPCGLLTLGYAYASRRVSAVDLPIVGTFFWIAAEWLRDQYLGWAMLGHSQFRELWLIQVADLGGVFAVSFVMALVSISVAELISATANRAVGIAAGARALILPAAALVVSFQYGAMAREIYEASPAESVSNVESFESTTAAVLPASWSPNAPAQFITAASPADRGPAVALPDLRVRQVSTIEENGVRVSPLLCQDLLNGDLVHQVVEAGADVLINNCRVPWMADASSGANAQHLAVAVFRSVESRRFLVRATNDGAGELITAAGETHREKPSGQSLAIAEGTTNYLRYGNTWILAGFGLALIVVGRGRRS